MIRLFLAAAIAAQAAIACATPAHAITEEDFHKIAAGIFLPIMEEHDIPGLAVGVTLNGEDFTFTHGEAVRETHAPVTTDTIFELGSISKLFNVTLAVLAEQRGLLSLTDAVSTHMPALQGTAFDDITLLNLATHTTGGLPLQVPDDVTSAGDDLTAYLRAFAPEGDPNASRSYSNVSIGILGKLTAEKFGRPYADVAEEVLFKGLGLDNTFISVPADAADRYAFGYSRDGDRPVRVNPGVLDAEAYGVKSSISDLIRFLEANLGSVPVPGEFAAALAGTRTGYFETQYYVQDLIWEQYPWPVDVERLKAGNSSEMALKMQPVERLDPPREQSSQVFLNKTGSTGGFGAYVALLPSEKLGVAVLANRNYPNQVRAAATYRLIQQIQSANAD